MKIMSLLLVFIPVSFILEFVSVSPVIMFIVPCLAILPLAMYMGVATEEIACYTGPKLGGFLNATFGNATELIIAFFALRAGLYDVVKASIAGSVMGNILLVLGASMFFGGIKHGTQKLDKKTMEVSANMLTFAVIGLCVPAVFLHTVRPDLINSWKYEPLNISLAVIMLAIYIMGVFFSFSMVEETVDESATAKWSKNKAIIVLVMATVIIAFESEMLVGAIEPLTKVIGISEFFVGIILIPIVGNAAEHSTAIWMSMKNKMTIATEIAVGSCLQIVLFVMPVLILIGAFIGRPMSVVFNTFELISLIVAIVIANRVTSDAESNWLEGMQLMAVYVIIAACFLWIGG